MNQLANQALVIYRGFLNRGLNPEDASQHTSLCLLAEGVHQTLAANAAQEARLIDDEERKTLKFPTPPEEEAGPPGRPRGRPRKGE